MTNSKVYAGWISGLPHILKPELNSGYKNLYQAAERLGQQLNELGVARIVYYSTQWISVLGQSVQVREKSKGLHVDENWYDLGPIPYEFNGDVGFAKKVSAQLVSSGFQVRDVDYDGFPIDTGTIVVDRLINPQKIPTTMISCCVYSDFNETIRIGKNLSEVVDRADGKTAVIVVSGLSGRYFTREIDMREDQFSDSNDDKWNKKILSAFASGDWESVQKMKDNFCAETKADMGLKALAFLDGLGICNGRTKFETHAYAPVYGTGAAVMSSFPIGR